MAVKQGKSTDTDSIRYFKLSLPINLNNVQDAVF